VGKWREMFEARLPPVADRECGEEYEFGPPATEEQLAVVEISLGIYLPVDLRDLMSEFNGVWYTTKVGRERGYGRDNLLFDTKGMSVSVPEYFTSCGGNPLPPADDLRKVVFFAQNNGFAYLWGVCVEDVAGYFAGEVVGLDHEVGELEHRQWSLAEYVHSFAGQRFTLPWTEVVTFDETQIVCHRSASTTEELTWDELAAVEIATTVTGPVVRDLFLTLHGSQRGLTISLDSFGTKELLQRIRKLAGFNNRAVISAMSHGANGRFSLWQR
jgi:hypothetical protein